jgi:hypothetical protein
MLDRRSDVSSMGLVQAAERIARLEQLAAQGKVSAQEHQLVLSEQLAQFRESVTSRADAAKHGVTCQYISENFTDTLVHLLS